MYQSDASDCMNAQNGLSETSQQMPNHFTIVPRKKVVFISVLAKKKTNVSPHAFACLFRHLSGWGPVYQSFCYRLFFYECTFRECTIKNATPPAACSTVVRIDEIIEIVVVVAAVFIVVVRVISILVVSNGTAQLPLIIFVFFSFRDYSQ